MIFNEQRSHLFRFRHWLASASRGRCSPWRGLPPAAPPTDEEQVVPHEVDAVSFSERSVELDTGAGGDDTLFVLFGLLAVGTLQHGEGAAARLRVHRNTH